MSRAEDCLGWRRQQRGDFLDARAASFNFKLSIACPGQLRPDKAVIDAARAAGADVEVTDDPTMAVADANCVVTDTWVSMGQTDEGYRKATSCAVCSG